MKKISTLALAILLLPVAYAVRIEEVYYDPINSETGGEAIVLYNPSDDIIDISGWVIKSESSANDATISSGKKIYGKGYFLIADANWDANKDNPDWSSADHEEAITLTNTDSGIALMNGTTVVDRVGWGNPINIEDNMYETQPAAMVDEGKSLKRIQDTNNNSNDFIESVPEMRASSGNYNQTRISISLSVQSYSVSIGSINITPDDFSEDGVQIIPNPGENKEINVKALVTHETNASLIEDVELEGHDMQQLEIINTTSAYYQGKLNISYNTMPGIYSLHVESGDNSKSAQYEIKELAAMQVDSLNLNLNIRSKNQFYYIYGDENTSTVDKPTIKNIGNIELDFGVKGTNFTGTYNNISMNNVKYSFDNVFNSSKSGTLSSQFVLIETDLMPSYLNELGFEFFIPEEARGNYSGSVVVSAIGSE